MLGPHRAPSDGLPREKPSTTNERQETHSACCPGGADASDLLSGSTAVRREREAADHPWAMPLPRPASRAATMAWARSARWSLAKTLEMWLLTVLPLMDSRAAI